MAAQAEELHFCMQGKSFQPGQEFLQTRQLRLVNDGPDLGEWAIPLARQAIRAQFWPQLALEEIQLAPFAEELCGYEPQAELQLQITAQDLATLAAERSRGSDAPSAQQLARQARGQAAPEKPSPAPETGQRAFQWFQLYYVTSRQPTGETGAEKAYGAEFSPHLNWGTVQVSIPREHRMGQIESPSVLRLEWDSNPQRHITLAPQVRNLSPEAWQAEVRRRAVALGKPGVLLFIHGYNNSFAEAAQRAAQLGHDLAFPGPVLLYSWPSSGTAWQYLHDEEEARITWQHMSELLDQLSRLAPATPVYVIAHSMGNRILTQGLADLLRRNPGADRAFRHIVLAAPDIGREEFRQRWLDLNSVNAPRYTLYASQHDLPVAASAWLHGETRLGVGGKEITVLNGLDSIDASRLTQEWFGLRHSYFGEQRTLLADLYLLINRNLPPEQRPGLRPMTRQQQHYWEFQP